MKTSKPLLIFLLIWGSFFCGCTPKNQAKSRKEGISFYSAIPVTLTSTNIPLLSVEVEGNTFPMKLDLGFRGDLCLSPSSIQSLQNKKDVGEKRMYGIRGKKYVEKCYQIPQISIHNLTFSHLLAQEENKEFLQDATFPGNRKAPPIKKPDYGLLGWKLFRKTKMFIDIPHSQIVFSDSLETLQNNGFCKGNFKRTSLFLDHGLIEFEVNLSGKTLRCLLDTGASINLLNDSSISQSLDEVIWNQGENLCIEIGEKSFGPIRFVRAPLDLPTKVDAILGMEFLLNHQVFLDLPTQSLYILEM